MRTGMRWRGTGSRGRAGRTHRDSRVRWRRVGVAAAGAGASVLLAGCGVPTTGVVDVGVPASGLPRVPASLSPVIVYFVDGGRLQPAKQGMVGDTDPVRAAVTLLFAGPAAAGRPDLTTRLPHVTAPVEVRRDGGTVTVTLPAGLPAPDALGVRQVVCTAAAAARLGIPLHVMPPTSGGSAPGAAVPDSATAETAAASVSVRLAIRGSTWHRTQSDPACPP